MCKDIKLEQRVKFAATMDIILASLILITCGVDMSKLLKNLDNTDGNSDDERRENRAALIVIYITGALAVLKLCMGFVLWQGALKKDTKKCVAWIYVSCIIWLIQLANLITKLIVGTFVIYSTISTSLALLIRILVIYIVFSFIEQIKKEEDEPEPSSVDFI